MSRSISRLMLVGIGTALLGCQSADTTRVVDPKRSLSEGFESVSPGGSLGPTEEAPLVSSFPPPWCDRAGAEGGERFDLVISIADGYWFNLKADCRTAGLTEAFTTFQGMQWLGYLIEYTYLMTGCPLEEEPISDGLAAFGLANTPILGVDRPLLGRDDVALLIAIYVDTFGKALNLTPDEILILEEHLSSRAQMEIDPTAAATLSTCPEGAAGAP